MEAPLQRDLSFSFYSVGYTDGTERRIVIFVCFGTLKSSYFHLELCQVHEIGGQVVAFNHVQLENMMPSLSSFS